MEDIEGYGDGFPESIGLSSRGMNWSDVGFRKQGDAHYPTSKMKAGTLSDVSVYVQRSLNSEGMSLNNSSKDVDFRKRDWAPVDYHCHSACGR